MQELLHPLINQRSPIFWAEGSEASVSRRGAGLQSDMGFLGFGSSDEHAPPKMVASQVTLRIHPAGPWWTGRAMVMACKDVAHCRRLLVVAACCSLGLKCEGVVASRICHRICESDTPGIKLLDGCLKACD